MYLINMIGYDKRVCRPEPVKTTNFLQTPPDDCESRKRFESNLSGNLL